MNPAENAPADGEWAPQESPPQECSLQVCSPQVFPPMGMIRAEEASRILGVSGDVFKRWRLQGRVLSGRKVAKPDRGWCKVYELAEIDQLRRERAAELAAGATLPEGFVRRHEACRIVGVAMTTWKRWQRAGRIPGGQTFRLSGERSTIKIYHRETLRRGVIHRFADAHGRCGAPLLRIDCSKTSSLLFG